MKSFNQLKMEHSKKQVTNVNHMNKNRKQNPQERSVEKRNRKEKGRLEKKEKRKKKAGRLDLNHHDRSGGKPLGHGN